MNDLKKWIKTFQKLKEEDAPAFKSHYISNTLNQHEKNQYAVLHAALVSFNGKISQNQERLYKFWLPAISAELKLSEVINQAQNFDTDKLKESVTLIKEKEIFELFLLDVLVFSRLEGVLSEDLKKVLNEWCQLLDIQQQDIINIIDICDAILGIENFETKKINTTLFKLISNATWSEFYINELNKSNITNIKPGLWMLNDDIEINESVVVNDSIIVFNNNSRIIKTDKDISFNDSSLINPRFEILGARLNITDSKLLGKKDNKEKFTAIQCSVGTVDIINCHASLTGIRVIELKNDANTTIHDSIFSYCGCEELPGGVLYSERRHWIRGCKFEHCNALIGGALYVERNNIGVDCAFYDCNSKLNVNSENYVNFGGIYTVHCIDSVLIDCTINTNITLAIPSSNVIRDSVFSGNVYYTKGHPRSRIFDNSTVSKSGLSDTDANMIPVSELVYWSNIENL